jgi:heme-transporting ATPase
MLQFDNLCKRHGERIVFQGLHYSAGVGCIALNDETGSGKSTLLGILAGTIEADRGEVRIDGHAWQTMPREASATLAYIPEDCMPDPLLSGREYLEQVALSRSATVGPHALDLAQRFGLEPHLEKRFEQMSFGTRKKVFLTASTLGRPGVIIADEPTGGLDAAARTVLIELFRTLGEDRTVFFSSYDMAFTQACNAKTISFADLGAHPVQPAFDHP